MEVKLIHNHPASEGLDSFGQDDFVFIRDNPGIGELIAVNAEYTYSVKVIKDMSKIVYTDMEEWGLIGVSQGEMYQHGSFTVLAEKGYVEYERKKIK